MRQGTRQKSRFGAPWRRLRVQVLREEPLCRMCQAIGRVEPAVDVDHIVPWAQGGTDDRANLQPLCHSCHSRKTAADKRGAAVQGCGPDGWPVDHRHPWQAGGQGAQG